MKSAVLHPKVKPLTNLDLTMPEQSLKRLASPAVIDFGPPNRLFNPMPWQKAADGHLILRDSVGPNRIVVTNITPLFLVLTLDSVTPSDAGSKYVIGIEKKPPQTPGQRNKRRSLVSLPRPTTHRTFLILMSKATPN